MPADPRNLKEAIAYFSDPDRCLDYLAARRWPHGVSCPVCGSTNVTFLKAQRRWQCAARHPKRQFSVKVGTLFEDSALGLDKWLAAVWLVTNSRRRASSFEIHRTIGVTQKTGWYILHRIRLAMQSNGSGES